MMSHAPYRYERLLVLRLNFGAWHRHAAEQAALYRREQEAKEQQLMLKAMLQEFEKMDANAAEAEAAEAAAAEQAQLDVSRKEKEQKSYWKKQRKEADARANNKVRSADQDEDGVRGNKFAAKQK